MKYLIASDLHLGNGGRYDIFAGADALPALLAEVAPQHLIVNGDGFDFLLDDEPIDQLVVGRAVRQAEAIAEHNADVLAAWGRCPKVTIRLGNHDVELAVPRVQAVFAAAIQRGGDAEVAFELGDAVSPIVVRGARILVTHGEHDDVANRIQYQRLRGAHTADAPEGTRGSARPFRYPPGSHLVKDGLNWVKSELGARFADLAKPDFQGGALATAFLWPEQTAAKLRALFPSLAARYVRAWATTPRPFDEGDGLDVDANDDLDAIAGAAALEMYARAHQFIAGEAAERFLSFEATNAERREAKRLLRKFDCDAVVMGHSHAARFLAEPGLTYLNSGTWIPLVQMPPADAPRAEWQVFLQRLRSDPQMTGEAQRYLTTRFTAVAVDEAPLGARLSLVEWLDGALLTHDSTEVSRQRAPAFHAPRREADPGTYTPLLADPEGAPFADMGLPLPRQFGVDAVPEPDDPRNKLLGPGTDANDVGAAHWGLIVPADRRAAFEEALQPLLALRASQMGVAPKVFEVAPGDAHDAKSALRWVEAEYTSIDWEERPEYLLIAGDLHEVPHALHKALSTQAMVGRIAFTRPDAARTPWLAGYGAYASKVATYATRTRRDGAELLYFGVEDGTAATRTGTRTLLDPSYDRFAGRVRERPHRFSAVHRIEGDGLGAPCPEDLLDHPAVHGRNLLVTLSHGVGFTNASSERFAQQGAMSFGYERLTASDLEASTFLPGGLWVYIACFGAGTPTDSDYQTWLDKLDATGRGGRAVLQTLSETPFVAALPQAALANPNGPLGVVGHIDLAWTSAMQDRTVPDSPLAGHARYDALLEQQERVGHYAPRTFGLSLRALDHGVRRMNDRLVDDVRQGRPYENPNLWLAHEDLRNYVLLGDPAARLG